MPQYQAYSLPVGAVAQVIFAVRARQAQLSTKCRHVDAVLRLPLFDPVPVIPWVLAACDAGDGVYDGIVLFPASGGLPYPTTRK